jgi:hypothetical protein
MARYQRGAAIPKQKTPFLIDDRNAGGKEVERVDHRLEGYFAHLITFLSFALLYEIIA